MKRILTLFAGLLLGANAFAQEVYFQIDRLTLSSPALFNIEKPSRLQDMNVIANTRFMSDNSFANGNFTESKFQLDEFRLEIVGSLSRNLYYRFRDVYASRPTTPNTQDLMRNSIDLAFMELRISPTWYIAAGKIATAWGSYEFDTNPVFIYAFNDMIQYGAHFVAGAQSLWKISENHSLTFQVVNSRVNSFDLNYPTAPPGVVGAKAALGTTVNWRGNFGDGFYRPLVSFSEYTEAKGKMAYYVAVGNEFNVNDRLKFQYDFKYSWEDIDRLGTVTRILAPSGVYPFTPLNVRYMEHWLLTEYFFAPKWSTTIVGMVNSAYWTDNPLPATGDNAATNLLRNSWGFQAMVEFHPHKFYNTKVFAGYIGRYNNLTGFARDITGLRSDNTGRIVVGILSPLVLF